MCAWSMGQSGKARHGSQRLMAPTTPLFGSLALQGDQRLHGYNGDTGAVVYAGGGSNELMTGTRQWNTGIVARGRIYFGADNKGSMPLSCRTGRRRQHLLLRPPRLLRQLQLHLNSDGNSYCHATASQS